MKLICETSSIFWTWQRQKRNNAARLPQFLNLTTSKTKRIFETSSIFEVDNIKNEAIVQGFLQKWKVECSADGLVPMRFAIFPPHLSKVLRLPRKSDARSCEALHLSRKIIFPKLKIWCSKMQSLLISPMNMCLALRLPCKMHPCRSSSNVSRLPSFLEMRQNPHVLLPFDKVHNPWRLPRNTTSDRPKIFLTRQFFTLLTSKCALRHNGVHFSDISTSKSAPNLVCFVHFHFKICFAPQRRALFRHLNFKKCSEPGVLWIEHFDFEMCFAPQRCALFRHLNFKKCSEPGVFCAFWLGNLLRATTACNFSSLIWPDGSAPAALASLLFDPPELQIIGKHSVSRLSYLFAHLDLLSSETWSFLSFYLLLFSSLLFSSLTLPISAFHLSILSEVWLLNFLRLSLSLSSLLSSLLLLSLLVSLLWSLSLLLSLSLSLLLFLSLSLSSK